MAYSYSNFLSIQRIITCIEKWICFEIEYTKTVFYTNQQSRIENFDRRSRNEVVLYRLINVDANKIIELITDKY